MDERLLTLRSRGRPRELVGRGSRKAVRFNEDKPKTLNKSMYKADKRAEPWPTIDRGSARIMA
jgi:hypothetical protein